MQDRFRQAIADFDNEGVIALLPALVEAHANSLGAGIFDTSSAFNVNVIKVFQQTLAAQLLKIRFVRQMWFLMENRKWKYPEIFNEKTLLHKNYHGKIKNDKYNNMGTDVLMAICVGLRLNLRIIEKIFEKSGNKLNYYKDLDRTYIHILENMPGLSIQDFNSVLEQADIPQLGSTIKIDEN